MKIEGYTRVTDVLYPFSGLKHINPLVLANAASRGSLVHNFCDAIVNKCGLFGLDQAIRDYIQSDDCFDLEKEKCENLIKSFEQWHIGKNFIPKPERFFCDELKITGECDFIYKDCLDRLVLVDLKTCTKESKTWLLQGSAYSYLAKKKGYNVEDIIFLRLSKEGGKPKAYSYQENFSLFRSCLDAYRYFFEEAEIHCDLDYL